MACPFLFQIICTLVCTMYLVSQCGGGSLDINSYKGKHDRRDDRSPDHDCDDDNQENDDDCGDGDYYDYYYYYYYDDDGDDDYYYDDYYGDYYDD